LSYNPHMHRSALQSGSTKFICVG